MATLVSLYRRQVVPPLVPPQVYLLERVYRVAPQVEPRRLVDRQVRRVRVRRRRVETVFQEQVEWPVVDDLLEVPSQ